MNYWGGGNCKGNPMVGKINGDRMRELSRSIQGKNSGV